MISGFGVDHGISKALGDQSAQLARRAQKGYRLAASSKRALNGPLALKNTPGTGPRITGLSREDVLRLDRFNKEREVTQLNRWQGLAQGHEAKLKRISQKTGRS